MLAPRLQSGLRGVAGRVNAAWEQCGEYLGASAMGEPQTSMEAPHGPIQRDVGTPRCTARAGVGRHSGPGLAVVHRDEAAAGAKLLQARQRSGRS